MGKEKTRWGSRVLRWHTRDEYGVVCPTERLCSTNMKGGTRCLVDHE